MVVIVLLHIFPQWYIEINDKNIKGNIAGDFIYTKCLDKSSVLYTVSIIETENTAETLDLWVYYSNQKQNSTMKMILFPRKFFLQILGKILLEGYEFLKKMIFLTKNYKTNQSKGMRMLIIIKFSCLNVTLSSPQSQCPLKIIRFIQHKVQLNNWEQYFQGKITDFCIREQQLTKVKYCQTILRDVNALWSFFMDWHCSLLSTTVKVNANVVLATLQHRKLAHRTVYYSDYVFKWLDIFMHNN